MNNAKRGQSLLVIVLLISVVFTLVATASYRFTAETQTSKLQEESVRTLAAADSGIERGLQIAANQTSPAEVRNYQQAFSGSNVTLAGINQIASTITITKDSIKEFTTPTINKDEQYLFYLFDYPTGTSYFRNDFKIYYASSGESCNATRPPALELTLIYGAGNGTGKVLRQIVDPCRDFTISPKVATSDTDTVRTGATCSPAACSVAGQSFNQWLLFQPSNLMDSADNPKTLIVRVLFAPTNLGFQTSVAADRFNAQGQRIEAKAVSNAGVSKVVRLFRSNPQLPADFFVTTF